ncbi:hypothetical protein [Hirschia maritima]|uniref:hypothetical protein n=1 Tax=Hirschia maritima TaxID=1121961 RepID=UPI00037A25E7|nr:hypothetical protein [Hirschia maritima]
MKKTIALAVCALALSACGGNHKSTLVKACVDEGEDKKMCACLADELEENTDEKTFALLAKAAKSGDLEDGIDGIPAEKKISVGLAMMGAAAKCAK